MDKRTMDELISYFNQEVSKMDISLENKMKLLGMISAIGYENKKQEVVRCKECKHRDPEDNGCDCAGHEMLLGGVIPMPDNWFCADGERKVQQ